MEDYFVPECYFDTVLVKTILRTKKVNHQKGCSNVVKEIIESKRLKDDFAVGIIDKHKKELDYIKNHCNEIVRTDNLILYKHNSKQHYFIQLIPAIEKWILNVAGESGLNLDKFGIPNDLYKLRKRTKSGLLNEDEMLKTFCKELVVAKGKTVELFIFWLTYLYQHNRNADINILKQNV